MKTNAAYPLSTDERAAHPYLGLDEAVFGVPSEGAVVGGVGAGELAEIVDSSIHGGVIIRGTGGGGRLVLDGGEDVAGGLVGEEGLEDGASALG